MRIGIDARELQGRPTGVGRYLRSLLRAWPAEARDVLIAYFNGAAPADPVLAEPRLVTRALGERPCRGLAWQEWRLPRAAADDQLDVFFAPAYACPLTLRVPRVTTLHDLSFFSLPQDFSLRDGVRRRALAAAAVRHSRRILAVSEFTRREILAHFPEAQDRVRVVPHGRDEDLPAAPAREEARKRLAVSGPLVLSVGAILNRRRLPELLHAVARLAARRAVRLDVAGENRTEPRVDFEQMIAALGLEARVRLSGFVTESALADRYAAADVAVVLSEYEGFGLPALEAMARGVPVVAADRPALSEVFGAAAMLVDPRDVFGIAAAIERVLDDDELRDSLVTRGRELAARHSWAAAAEKTRAALAEAAA